jgi:hypothetical protein
MRFESYKAGGRDSMLHITCQTWTLCKAKARCGTVSSRTVWNSNVFPLRTESPALLRLGSLRHHHQTRSISHSFNAFLFYVNTCSYVVMYLLACFLSQRKSRLKMLRCYFNVLHCCEFVSAFSNFWTTSLIFTKLGRSIMQPGATTEL